MAKLFGLKLWILYAVYLGAGVGIFQNKVKEFIQEFFPDWEKTLDGFFTTSMTAGIVWGLLAFFLWKPIWRKVWKIKYIGKWLSENIFPDLNGEWEMEIHSNWPVINKMRISAKDIAETRFDPLHEDTIIPDFSITKLPASIKQGWSKIEVEVDKNSLTPLLRSHTISVEILKAECGYPKRISWIFKQENSIAAHTDEQNFLGSALLNVSSDGRTLEGCYWNNRQWHKGLNAAGKIIMRRIAT